MSLNYTNLTPRLAASGSWLTIGVREVSQFDAAKHDDD
jgi:hypothetical protein